jgi:hypothetical protein
MDEPIVARHGERDNGTRGAINGDPTAPAPVTGRSAAPAW